MLRQQGFSLLEAIVALALLGSAGIALFNWLNGSLNSLTRVESAYDRLAGQQAALAFIETINPMTQPEGSETLGPYRITWQSVPMEGPVEGIAYPKWVWSYYRVGLYQTEVNISRKQQRIPGFVIRQNGYLRVRGADRQEEET